MATVTSESRILIIRASEHYASSDNSTLPAKYPNPEFQIFSAYLTSALQISLHRSELSMFQSGVSVCGR